MMTKVGFNVGKVLLSFQLYAVGMTCLDTTQHVS